MSSRRSTDRVQVAVFAAGCILVAVAIAMHLIAGAR